MATYLTLTRYTPDGLKAALAAGMPAREAMFRSVTEANGGEVLGFYFVTDGDWDLVTIAKYPQQPSLGDQARNIAGFKAGGALDAMRTFHLVTAAEMEAGSRATEQTYRPPAEV